MSLWYLRATATMIVRTIGISSFWTMPAGLKLPDNVETGELPWI